MVCLSASPVDRALVEDGMNFDRELDARGLNCPLPILRTKKALNDMTSGQVLRVSATDPNSVRDFQAFSRQTGHELLASSADAGEFAFLLKKK
jgi:tRNA 2-thiouridine synthesizing protein A